MQAVKGRRTIAPGFGQAHHEKQASGGRSAVADIPQDLLRTAALTRSNALCPPLRGGSMPTRWRGCGEQRPKGRSNARGERPPTRPEYAARTGPVIRPSVLGALAAIDGVAPSIERGTRV